MSFAMAKVQSAGQQNAMSTAISGPTTSITPNIFTSFGQIGTEEKATGWPVTGGSGPVPGIIGISGQTSTAALNNYYPKGGAVEFVYDPVNNIFVVGRPSAGLFTGSPHQQLARSIGGPD